MTPAQALFVENDYTIIMINVRDIQFKSYFHTPKRHTWKELHRIIQLFNVPNFYMVTFGKYIFLGKYLFYTRNFAFVSTWNYTLLSSNAWKNLINQLLKHYTSVYMQIKTCKLDSISLHKELLYRIKTFIWFYNIFI